MRIVGGPIPTCVRVRNVVGNLVVLFHGELGRILKIKVLEESQSSDFTSQNWRAADEELKKNSLGSWPSRPTKVGRSSSVVSANQ